MSRFKKWIAGTLFLILLFTVPFPAVLWAAESEQETNRSMYTQTDLDIMFVVDYSNSMNANDRNKMALQMIGAFVNTAFSTKTRIGYTAYNHTIIKSQKPQSISTKKKRDSLRKQIEGISRSGSTDIGLALKHAQTLLDTGSNRKTILIVISDGETDLTYADTGRTKKNSDRDAAKAAEACAKAGIPIYTIAFSDAYDGNSEALKELSQQTGAAAYRASKPEALVDIFNEITKDTTMSSVMPIGDGVSAGSRQEIEIPLDHSEEIKEANILVVSSSAIEEASLLYSGKGSSFHKSPYYFSGKIVNPNQDKATLQIRTKADSNLKIYLKLYHDLDFRVEWPKTIKKKEPFTVTGYFFNNNTKQPVTNQDFYEEFTASIDINGDGAKTENAIQNTDISFEGGSLKSSVTVSQTGQYQLDYIMKSRLNSLSLKNIGITAVNDSPGGEFETEFTYPTIKKEQSFDLDQYFTDPNQDKLTYRLIEEKGSGASAVIEDNLLRLQAKAPGVYRFKIQAADEDGAQIKSQETVITVEPVWKYYYGITIALIAAAAILLLLLLLRGYRKLKKAPKPYYSGKLNLYFTKMPDGEEIEALTFTLYPLEIKAISLETLLDGAGIRIKELDGSRVHFLPSYDKKIILQHNSSLSVMLGSSIVCRGLKYSVEYGNKIYIASKDGEYELEIHFLSATKNN